MTSLVIGTIGILVAGAFVGTLVSFLLRITGPDFAWLKGLGVGAVLWPVHVSFLPGLLGPRVFSTLPPVMVIGSLFLSLLWGLTTGLILQLLVREELRPEG